jgi:membrane fusion protein (multidrug efflux system)
METENSPPLHSKRNLILGSMTAFFLLVALGVFLYWLLWGRFHEYTNDAYVSGNLVYVTPQVSGIVTSIYIDDTELVDEGHLLIELDKTDFQIALDLSKADLADQIRSVAQLFLQVKQAVATVQVAKTQLAQNAEDFERRKALVDSGSVSIETFQHSEHALAASFFSLAASEASYFSLFAQIDKTTIEHHPRVRKAEQHLKDAFVQMSRSTLRAPVKGLIAERTVQVGQRVQAGEPLFSIIPLDQMWVDANFKEVQIGKMQIGQHVSIYSDVYGGSVEYHGRIGGIGGGTGSVFSVLPPQNATGNWIKIVQRVPVRIFLDPKEIIAHPLRLGLSMETTVDIHDIHESSIPSLIPTRPLYKTDIFINEEEGVAKLIEEIFKANLPPTRIPLSELVLP